MQKWRCKMRVAFCACFLVGGLTSALAADMLVNEVFSRHLRDGKAVAHGLSGSERPRRRRERGLARAGNTRVRCGMIQLAWRFCSGSKKSALAQWFQARTADGRGNTRKTMIVALGH